MTRTDEKRRGSPTEQRMANSRRHRGRKTQTDGRTDVRLSVRLCAMYIGLRNETT